MENHITYLLGAGASYQSMPVVAELNDDLRLLDYHNEDGPSLIVGRYRGYHNEREPPPTEPECADWMFRLEEIIHEVMSDIDGFSTIDTLAKFWTVTSPNKLQNLKKAINLYFAMRHFTPHIAIAKPRDVWDKKQGKWVPRYKANYDTRYDGLIAGLVSADTLQHPKNVNYISYNYDLELESSIVKFGLNKPSGSKGTVDIYHVNGSCTNLLDHETVSEEERLSSIISHGGAIGYAWEQISKAKSEIEVKLSQTTHLVVIGYSFPVFNREIDRQILAANYLEKIYIQDKPDALPGIENRVKALLAERANFAPAEYKIIKTKDDTQRMKTAEQVGVEIEPVDSVDQFHIPFELI